MDKANMANILSPMVSRWANDSKGIECIANPANLLLGAVVLFAARTLGFYYAICNTPAQFGSFTAKAKRHFTISSLVFVPSPLTTFITFIPLLVTLLPVPSL